MYEKCIHLFKLLHGVQTVWYAQTVYKLQKLAFIQMVSRMQNQLESVHEFTFTFKRFLNFSLDFRKFYPPCINHFFQQLFVDFNLLLVQLESMFFAIEEFIFNFEFIEGYQFFGPHMIQFIVHEDWTILVDSGDLLGQFLVYALVGIHFILVRQHYSFDRVLGQGFATFFGFWVSGNDHRV